MFTAITEYLSLPISGGSEYLPKVVNEVKGRIMAISQPTSFCHVSTEINSIVWPFPFCGLAGGESEQLLSVHLIHTSSQCSPSSWQDLLEGLREEFLRRSMQLHTYPPSGENLPIDCFPCENYHSSTHELCR